MRPSDLLLGKRARVQVVAGFAFQNLKISILMSHVKYDIIFEFRHKQGST